MNKLRIPGLDPKTAIAVVSTLIVTLIAVVDAGRTSPGALTEVHGRIPELAGSNSCNECHGGWASSMTDSCLECHETIRTHLVLGEGLHGTLDPVEAERCGRCHSDHHGEGFAVVNLSSFRQAGIREIEAFDHALIGWEMEGAHTELDCSECHTNADAGVLPEGEHRFLGLSTNCSDCHEDPHEGRMRLDCASCHSQADFEERAFHGHDDLLPLVGGHGDVTCRECHAEDGDGALELIAPRVAGRPDVRECRTCHEDPHAQSFVEGVAALTALAPGASCVTCHVAEHESFRAPDIEVTPEHHATSGFMLRAPHKELECSECHAPDLPEFAERHPGRGPDECSACHADPHGGQFEEGPFSDRDCVACHQRTHFEPHAFGVDKHARAGLRLDGAHVELDCQDCHEAPNPEEPRVFRGTASDCDDCHSDAHAGYFAPLAPDLRETRHGLCAACHQTEAFDHELDFFRHDAHANFALDGAHSQAACESCHPRADEPDELGRSFGRIRDHFGAIEGCASCHDDPHGGDFDGPGLPATIDGRADCARCHTTASFRSLHGDWDHRRWTGFALDGAHAEASCSDCHTPLHTIDERGRTWAPAAGARCADCHEDPHGGQFALAESTSCERCHESTDAWAELDFNHERDARFPLGASHAEVACDACHKPADPSAEENQAGAAMPLGAGVVRYRPLPMGCVDCHGTLDGPTIRRRVK